MNMPVKNRRQESLLSKRRGLAPLSAAVPVPLPHWPSDRENLVLIGNCSSRSLATGTRRLVVPMMNRMVPFGIAIFTLDSVWE